MSQSGNKISAAGAEALADALKELKGLKELNVRSKSVLRVLAIAHSRRSHTHTTPWGEGSNGRLRAVWFQILALMSANMLELLFVRARMHGLQRSSQSYNYTSFATSRTCISAIITPHPHPRFRAG